MNFGQNLLEWFVAQAKPLAILGIMAGALYFLFKKETTKLIVYGIVAVLVILIIWNYEAVVDFFLNIGNWVIGA